MQGRNGFLCIQRSGALDATPPPPGRRHRCRALCLRDQSRCAEVFHGIGRFRFVARIGVEAHEAPSPASPVIDQNSFVVRSSSPMKAVSSPDRASGGRSARPRCDNRRKTGHRCCFLSALTPAIRNRVRRAKWICTFFSEAARVQFFAHLIRQALPVGGFVLDNRDVFAGVFLGDEFGNYGALLIIAAAGAEDVFETLFGQRRTCGARARSSLCLPRYRVFDAGMAEPEHMWPITPNTFSPLNSLAMATACFGSQASSLIIKMQFLPHARHLRH